MISHEPEMHIFHASYVFLITGIPVLGLEYILTPGI